MSGYVSSSRFTCYSGFLLRNFALRELRNANKMLNMNNPFLIVGYQGPEYFCDREKETEVILSALHNGRNITL